MSTDIESPVVTAAAVPAAPDLEPEAAYKPKREAIWRVIVPPFLVGAATVGFWYFISYVILEPKRRFLLQPPHRVWQEGFADSETLSEMFKGLWSSGRVAFWGLLIAIALGFTLAIVMSQAKMLERAFFPYFVMLQAIPILAIVPLIGFWFGYGRSSRIVVCVIIAIFPIIVNTLFGLLSADSGLHDLLTLHGAGRLTRIRKVMFPAALPAIFAGLRISAGLSVIGAIVGDFFFGKGDIGIGQLLKRYVARIEGEKLLAAVILSCALGVAVFVFFGWLANRVAGKWAPAVRGKK